MSHNVKKKSPLQGKGGLVMLAVVVVLGALFFLDQKAPPPRDPNSPPPVSEYAHLRSGDVTRIEVKHAEEGEANNFVLVKQDGDWRFEAPAQFRANSDEVDNWLKGMLENATVAQAIEGKADNPATYGLDKPKVEVILTSGRGETRTLQLGKEFTVPGGTGSPMFYARERKDGRLFMLDGTQYDNIADKKLDDLRDKRLVEIEDTANINKVALVRPNGTVEVERKGDKWVLNQPFSAPGDSSAIEHDLLAQLQSAEAQRFVENAASDLAKYGLDKPSLTIRVTNKKGKTRAVLFGKTTPDGSVYAMREGGTEVTALPTSSFDLLNKQASDLRDRSLLSLERDRISYIEIQNSHGTTKLQKVSGDKWEIADATAPKPRKARGDMVDQVLSTLLAPASRHVSEAPKDLAQYGLDKPEITVRVNAGAGTSQVISISKEMESVHYAKGANPSVFEVQPYVFNDLNLAPKAFVDESK